MKIYHNPSCSKSCATMDLLKEHGQLPEVIEYLEEKPSEEELGDILTKLGISAFDLIRKGEEIYLEKYEGRDLSEADWIQAMVDHPVLMERPIVIKGNQAIIGRPPKRVLELL